MTRAEVHAAAAAELKVSIATQGSVAAVERGMRQGEADDREDAGFILFVSLYIHRGYSFCHSVTLSTCLFSRERFFSAIETNL